MSIALWDDSFLTGHHLVDTQHQELFHMVNHLHDAIIAQKDKEILSSLLEKLTHYTVEHFEAEEALMVKINYPHLTVHQRKHNELAQQAKEIIENYRTGKYVLSITLSRFLSNWLRHHIKEDDMALVQYIHAHS
ncbi:MAG: bacteriohemerythrin [Blastocatellia bacterium]|nr:bacteriohemerythrin [Blastocatellia bacterium]